jgi:hypothetical protein
MTLISDLIDIPDQVQEGDFVLKLTQGVDPAQAKRTVEQYVVTPQLVDAFKEALDLIEAGVSRASSQASYLHGSFGSGKSHFMAVLHLLLQRDPHARSIPELQDAIKKWDEKVGEKRFLLVPLHFLTAKSMDATILGGYVNHVLQAHPDAPVPAVFIGDEILEDELPGMRRHLGEDRFVEELNSAAGGDDDGWGEFGTEWTTARIDETLAGNDPGSRHELAAAYIGAFRQATLAEARAVGEGFIGLDDGLSAISVHAHSLGYDGVVLFLDELILWLASNIGNLDFVQRESQKLTKLVEAENAHRPAPIISFVARQRDLREFVGDQVAGSELRSLGDILELEQGRFGTITLEDRNLPVIANKRILTPKNEDARVQLRAAVDDALAGRDDIRRRLLPSDEDASLFRLVYPFSPAAIHALIAVSEALQRERTALKVMVQLLVDHRDDLELGEFVPVGDLWDVVAERDEPFSSELKEAFNTAKSLYRTKLRPMLLTEHGLTEDTSSDDPRWKAFQGDDRIVKTVLLAALVGKVEAFRNLDAARLVALNWGSVTSPIPHQETTVLASKLRNWNAQVGELKVSDDPANPTVSITLVSIDTDEIIRKATEAFDNLGVRRAVIRGLIDGLLDNRLKDQLFANITHEWRGTDRSFEVIFGNIRNTTELPDSQLQAVGDTPRIVIDFPFDEGGRGPEDDLERLDRFVESHNATATVCWIPSFFSAEGIKRLRTYTALTELLKTDQRYEQHTSHLSVSQRQQAKPILNSQRDVLRQQLQNALLAAYGVVDDSNNPLIDTSLSLREHFRALDPALDIRPSTQADMAGALGEICNQVLASQYPEHPRFDEKVTPAKRRTTWEEIERALGERDHRITVESKNRSALRTVANALELGTMHESHFVLGTNWKMRLDRYLNEAFAKGEHLTVGELRALIDEDGDSRRGMPNEIADLVIRTVAAQTDHAIVRLGVPVEADGGSALPGDANLVKQQLPDEQSWTSATERAAAIFGITASPMVSAPEVARFASLVKERANTASSATAGLVPRLEQAYQHVGAEDQGARLRTARASRELLAALQAAEGPQAVVHALAAAEIPTSEAAMAKSISTAPSVAEALGDTNWDLLGQGGAAIMAPLRSLLEMDELAQAFDPERRKLEADATKTRVTPKTTGHRHVITNPAELDAAVEQMRTAVEDGDRIELSWRRLTDE